MLPTPNAAKASYDMALDRSGDGRTKPNKLGWAVAMLPTPRHEGFDAGRHRDRADSLDRAAKMLPTPTRDDARNTPRGEQRTEYQSLIKTVLTSSPEDFPVSPSPPLERSGERETTAISGLNLLGLWPPSGPVGACLRMCLGSSIWQAGSPRYTLTWKEKGTPWGALLYRLRLSERRTAGTASGFWPTPCAQEDNKSPEAHMAMKQRMKGGPRNTITSLNVAVKADAMVGTPTAAMKHRSADHANGRTPNPKEIANATGMKLSAAWVSRMMGYPDGWMDDLPPDPLATP
jgi:hypothetical protein